MVTPTTWRSSTFTDFFRHGGNRIARPDHVRETLLRSVPADRQVSGDYTGKQPFIWLTSFSGNAPHAGRTRRVTPFPKADVRSDYDAQIVAPGRTAVEPAILAQSVRSHVRGAVLASKSGSGGVPSRTKLSSRTESPRLGHFDQRRAESSSS